MNRLLKKLRSKLGGALFGAILGLTAISSAQIVVNPPSSGGTVTTINTSSPITGGPITTTGTIGCPTCDVTGTALSQLSLTITPTDGTGFVALANQSPAPSTPIAGQRLYGSTAGLSWIGVNGFTRTFNAGSITANRAWILPDANGTIALTSDLGSYLPLAGGTMVGSILFSPTNTVDVGSSSQAPRDIHAARNFIVANNGVYTFENGDPSLIRENSSYLIQRNSTSAQRFSVANTYTSSTNNELFSVDWQTTANLALVGTRTAATGTSRTLGLVAQDANATNSYALLAIRYGPPFFNFGTSQATGAFGISYNTVSANPFVDLGTFISGGTSGTATIVGIRPTFSPASGTPVNTALLVQPTFNWGGTPGAGNYNALWVSAIETAVPSGTNYLIRASAGAAGTTDKFTVTSTGTVTSAGNITAGTDLGLAFNGNILWTNRGRMSSPSDGIITISNAALSDFTRLQFGGTTTSFPSLKRSGAALHVRLADDSAFAGISASNFNMQGTVSGTTGTLISVTAPTVSSGFGTSPSIASNNGTAAFTVNVGTGGVASSGVIGLPTATTGWNCFISDITSPSVNVTKQTASSTTSATIANYLSTTGIQTAWSASDVLGVSCFAY